MMLQKCFVRVAASLAVMAGLALNAAAVELAVNGDFETGDTTGWTLPLGPAGGQTWGVTSDAASGAWAGELFNDVAPAAWPVKQANIGVGIVQPNQAITISFDAKGSGVAGGVAFAELFSELSGGGTSATEILGGGPLALDGVNYQTYVFNTVTGPDVSGGVTLQFNAATGANTAAPRRLLIDNVSVSVIPEPASFAVLGLASLALGWPASSPLESISETRSFGTSQQV